MIFHLHHVIDDTKRLVFSISLDPCFIIMEMSPRILAPLKGEAKVVESLGEGGEAVRKS